MTYCSYTYFSDQGLLRGNLLFLKDCCMKFPFCGKLNSL